MKMRDVDQALAAANPVEWTELPPPSEREREFLEGVVAVPQEPAGRGRTLRRVPGTRGIWARYLGGAAAVCAGALALLLVPSSGPGPAPRTPAPAYADELARIAKEDPTAVVIRSLGRNGSTAVVVNRRLAGSRVSLQHSYTTYTVKPLRESDHGWKLYEPTVWDCTDLPCHRTDKDVRSLSRQLQGAGN